MCSFLASLVHVICGTALLHFTNEPAPRPEDACDLRRRLCCCKSPMVRTHFEALVAAALGHEGFPSYSAVRKSRDLMLLLILDLAAPGAVTG